jgi:hypothetical protein
MASLAAPIGKVIGEAEFKDVQEMTITSSPDMVIP